MWPALVERQRLRKRTWLFPTISSSAVLPAEVRANTFTCTSVRLISAGRTAPCATRGAGVDAGGVARMSTPPLEATMKVLLSLGLVASLSLSLQAQTIDDGIMLARRDLLTGNHYSYDRWDRYWEGTLKRMNGNIGRITTKANVWTANYGIADRLNVIAMVPYVWTPPARACSTASRASRTSRWRGSATFSTGRWTRSARCGPCRSCPAGIPLTDYNPELLPLSIGSGSTRVSGRVTAQLPVQSGMVSRTVRRPSPGARRSSSIGLLLHRWPVRDERPGRHAQRDRLRRRAPAT